MSSDPAVTDSALLACAFHHRAESPYVPKALGRWYHGRNTILWGIPSSARGVQVQALRLRRATLGLWAALASEARLLPARAWVARCTLYRVSAATCTQSPFAEATCTQFQALVVDPDACNTLNLLDFSLTPLPSRVGLHRFGCHPKRLRQPRYREPFRHHRRSHRYRLGCPTSWLARLPCSHRCQKAPSCSHRPAAVGSTVRVVRCPPAVRCLRKHPSKKGSFSRLRHHCHWGSSSHPPSTFHSSAEATRFHGPLLRSIDSVEGNSKNHMNSLQLEFFCWFS
jgi:hypothetical protein